MGKSRYYVRFFAPGPEGRTQEIQKRIGEGTGLDPAQARKMANQVSFLYGALAYAYQIVQRRGEAGEEGQSTGLCFFSGEVDPRKSTIRISQPFWKFTVPFSGRDTVIG
jgi:hypothetical protein